MLSGQRRPQRRASRENRTQASGVDRKPGSSVPDFAGAEGGPRHPADRTATLTRPAQRIRDGAGATINVSPITRYFASSVASELPPTHSVNVPGSTTRCMSSR